MIRHTVPAVTIFGALLQAPKEGRTARELCDLAPDLTRDQVNNGLRALASSGIATRSDVEPYSYKLVADLGSEQHLWTKKAVELLPKRQRQAESQKIVIPEDAIASSHSYIDKTTVVEVAEQHLLHEAIRGERTIGTLTTLRPEVVEWLALNLRGNWFPTANPLRLVFEDDGDAALFRLSWG